MSFNPAAYDPAAAPLFGQNAADVAVSHPIPKLSPWQTERGGTVYGGVDPNAPDGVSLSPTTVEWGVDTDEADSTVVTITGTKLDATSTSLLVNGAWRDLTVVSATSATFVLVLADCPDEDDVASVRIVGHGKWDAALTVTAVVTP